MATARIIILLDVDGVLNPRASRHSLHLDDARAQLVLELADIGEIVWATTWPGTYTAKLAGDLGLPSTTRAIAFPPDLQVDRHTLAPTPKLHWVARWLNRSIEEDTPNSTAVVWIDDRLGTDATTWANALLRPTLLVRPKAAVGLTAEHLAAIREFARSLETF